MRVGPKSARPDHRPVRYLLMALATGGVSDAVTKMRSGLVNLVAMNATMNVPVCGRCKPTSVVSFVSFRKRDEGLRAWSWVRVWTRG